MLTLECSHSSAHASAHASVHKVVWSYFTWPVLTCSVPHLSLEVKSSNCYKARDLERGHVRECLKTTADRNEIPEFLGRGCFHCKVRQKGSRFCTKTQQKVGLKNGKLIRCYGLLSVNSPALIISTNGVSSVKSANNRLNKG